MAKATPQCAQCRQRSPECERNGDIIHSRESQICTFVCLMSEPPSLRPTPPRRRTDRWSGRKTLIFIIAASLLLWAAIAWFIHVL
jgi:hypothetical protein